MNQGECVVRLSKYGEQDLPCMARYLVLHGGNVPLEGDLLLLSLTDGTLCKLVKYGGTVPYVVVWPEGWHTLFFLGDDITSESDVDA